MDDGLQREAKDKLTKATTIEPSHIIVYDKDRSWSWNLVHYISNKRKYNKALAEVYFVYGLYYNKMAEKYFFLIQTKLEVYLRLEVQKIFLES